MTGNCKNLNIGVLVACFNRRDTTLRGLNLLFNAAALVQYAKLTVFLVDDASTDGSAFAIKEAYPQINLVSGSGSLFWNGAMRLAHQTARIDPSIDCYLLFNDDVMLDEAILGPFVSCYLEQNAVTPTVLVGALRSSKTGEATYTGYLRSDSRRVLNLRAVDITDGVSTCDTFNGNFVLVPRQVFDVMDGFDRHYVHTMGDLDIGFRAADYGLAIAQFPGSVGICDRGKDFSLKLAESKFAGRFKLLFRRPFGVRQVLYFHWRHADKWLWPAYAVHSVAVRGRLLLFPRTGARVSDGTR